MKIRSFFPLSLLVTFLCFSLVILGSALPKTGTTQVTHTENGVLAAHTGVPVVAAATDFHLPPVTKTTGCVAQGPLPDVGCTPGAVFPTVTATDICRPGYSARVRNVPESVKKAVYAAYGVVTHVKGEYEVDHLISLELGGSNDIANLWPEPAEPTPGFHQKDIVENFLHTQVCDGVLSLREAQKVIATNWLDIFHQMRD